VISFLELSWSPTPSARKKAKGWGTQLVQNQAVRDLGAIIPLAVGMALGNLDSDLRAFPGGAAPVLILFFAFALGAGLNLKLVWGAGLLGLALGMAILLTSGIFLIVADRLNGGTGTAGIAAAATAGNAAAVPAPVAAANHKYAAAAGPATMLVAASVVVTSILAPVMTAWRHGLVRGLPHGRSKPASGSDG